MKASGQARATVLSRIRAALRLTGKQDGAREAAVEDRLNRHPRGTIPARALAYQEALLELLQTMLASQGAEVTLAATPEDALRAIAGGLRAHDIPPILRVGTDPVLEALPWETRPSLERRFGLGRAGRQGGTVSGPDGGGRDGHIVPRLRRR